MQPPLVNLDVGIYYLIAHFPKVWRWGNSINPWNILQTNVDIGQGMFAQWIETCTHPKFHQPEKVRDWKLKDDEN